MKLPKDDNSLVQANPEKQVNEFENKLSSLAGANPGQTFVSELAELVERMHTYKQINTCTAISQILNKWVYRPIYSVGYYGWPESKSPIDLAIADMLDVSTAKYITPREVRVRAGNAFNHLLKKAKGSDDDNIEVFLDKIPFAKSVLSENAKTKELSEDRIEDVFDEYVTAFVSNCDYYQMFTIKSENISCFGAGMSSYPGPIIRCEGNFRRIGGSENRYMIGGSIRVEGKVELIDNVMGGDIWVYGDVGKLGSVRNAEIGVTGTIKEISKEFECDYLQTRQSPPFVKNH